MSQKIIKNSTVISNRYEFIDISKGVSILLVVIGHIISNNTDIHRFIYSFHMVAFFMLSSLVLKTNVLDLKINQKILYFSNLWIPYFGFSIIYILFSVFEGFMQKSNNIVTQFIMNLFLTLSFNGIGVLWYLSSLLFSILIVSYFKHLRGFRCMFFILSCVALSLFIEMNIDYSSMILSLNGKILYYISVLASRVLLISTFIFLGIHIKYYIYLCYSNYSTYKYFKVIILLFTIIIITILFKTSNYNGIVDIHQMLLGNNFIWFVFNSLFGFLLILSISFLLADTKIGNKLAFIGQLSLIIMLYHNYFGVPNIAKGISLLVYNILPFEFTTIILEIVITLILITAIYIIIAKKIDNYIQILVMKLRFILSKQT